MKIILRLPLVILVVCFLGSGLVHAQGKGAAKAPQTTTKTVNKLPRSKQTSSQKSVKSNQPSKDLKASKKATTEATKPKVEWLKSSKSAMSVDKAKELCSADVAKVKYWSMTPYSHPIAVVGGSILSAAVYVSRARAAQNKCMATHGWKRKAAPPRPKQPRSTKD